MIYIFSKRSIAFWTVALMIISAACKKDFLDQKTLSVINEHAVFSDSAKSYAFVNGRYGNLHYSFDPRRYGNQCLEAACDEAEASLNLTTFPYKIVTGAANANNAESSIWSTTYTQVRACNVFLKNKDSIPVTQTTLNRWVGEIRFLRAWYLFTLFKHYGGIPIIGDKVFGLDDNINIPRSTYAQTVDYIAAECDTAASLLPVKDPLTSAIYYGRATKGAVLALKARLLLYAASPLANDGTRTDDPNHYVSYATADNNRWKKAADAAADVINLGVYSLYKGATPYFYSTFLQNTGCAEFVLAYWPPVTTQQNSWVEDLCNPPSRGWRYSISGQSSCFPIQELVDAFPMNNGLPITDQASGYSGIGDNMYLNRDPRLSATVLYNGAPRFYSGYGDQPVWTYTGVVPTGTPPQTSASKDGIYSSLATLTGYYRYKMCNNATPTSELYRPMVLIRYAEVLLNAAEATNEYYGPTNVYPWLKLIRDRAQIKPGTDGMYGIKANMSKEEMRAFIQNERRIELAFEEQRFWDIRRWKIAPTIESSETHGMEITRGADGKFSYRTIVVRKPVWNDKLYYYPIPQSEIVKSSALKQNPGY
ncbi:MAG: RagB/SusD family nutrient uptake outer membrane protein [Bacteroidota bacterium]|nr:RagB/SusD family nutrient uptake outer membrane protein [Bacteroidota bacterium]